MGIFGNLAKAVIDTAALPIDMASDVVMGMTDAVEDGEVGKRTRERIEKIKGDIDGDGNHE